jgi:fumarate reductase flavoprotein subunit
MDTSQKTVDKRIKTDIVVIGAGGAGMAAAVAATDEGAKVVLLEKRSAPGGNSARAQAFFAAESPAQKRLGIDAPRDVLFRMAMDYAHWKINPRIIRVFMDTSGDTVRWLEELGLGLIDRIPPLYPNQKIRTFHFPKNGGAEVVRVLRKACEDRGILLLRRTSASKILTNAQGEITGVMALSKEYKNLEIIARSLIIATGGYGGNKELLKKYFPEYTKDTRSTGIPHKGDGLLMATEIGAAIEGATLQWEGPIFEGARHGPGVNKEPDMIWVNKKGERFADESVAANHFESVNALLQQPGKVSYTLFDEKIKQDVIERIERGYIRYRGLVPRARKADPPDFSDDLRTEAKKGTVLISDTWDEIAKWIGASRKVLKTTIEGYNNCCDKGHDKIFAKERRYLIPLRTPPYYAMRCYAIFLTAIGGIKINHHMEVLNKEDNPIPGLYAAGNDTGGWEPDTYNAVLSGHAFAFALNSGRISGENAAKYVSGK